MSMIASLPALPALAADADPDLLSSMERTASSGGDTDPFVWLCAAGRLVRSSGIGAAIRSEARTACARATADDGMLAVTGARCDLELDALGALADSLEGEAPSTRVAWRIVSSRDNLESVAVALGSALRESPAGAPSTERLHALERRLVRNLRTLDEGLDGAEDQLVESLRAGTEANEAIARRVLAAEDDPSAGFWVALLLGLQPATQCLEGLEHRTRSTGEAPSPLGALWARVSSEVAEAVDDLRRVFLADWLTLGAEPQAAAGGNELFHAFAGLSPAPIATLAEGRITLRVARPVDPLDVESTLTGIGIEADDPAWIRGAWAEVDSERIATRPVAEVGRWFPLARVRGHRNFVLGVETADGRTHRIVVELVPDDAQH